MKSIDFFGDGKELACKCCGGMKVNQSFYDRLNVARAIADIGFVITSGCRCTKHNKTVGGVPGSSHEITATKECTAVDIACTDDAKRWIIIDALIRSGFTRIGINKSFIHVDSDATKNSKRIWVY